MKEGRKGKAEKENPMIKRGNEKENKGGKQMTKY